MTQTNNKSYLKMFHRSQRGQFFIEAVLLMVIFTSIGLLAVREIKKNNLYGRMVSGPWSHIRGMIENGAWDIAPKTLHPNMTSRHISRKGDPLK